MAKTPAKKSWRIQSLGFRNRSQELLNSCEHQLSSGDRFEYGFLPADGGEKTITWAVPGTRPTITGPIQFRWKTDDGTPHAVTVTAAQLEASGLQQDGELFFCVQPDGTVSLEPER